MGASGLEREELRCTTALMEHWTGEKRRPNVLRQSGAAALGVQGENVEGLAYQRLAMLRLEKSKQRGSLLVDNKRDNGLQKTREAGKLGRPRNPQSALHPRAAPPKHVWM